MTEPISRVQLEEGLAVFLGVCLSVTKDHYDRQKYSHIDLPKFSVDPGGKKYLRIVRDDGTQRSVYCFVDVANGDILFPHGWKAPAKGPSAKRGNIFDEDGGRSAVGPYGARYLR